MQRVDQTYGGHQENMEMNQDPHLYTSKNKGDLASHTGLARLAKIESDDELKEQQILYEPLVNKVKDLEKSNHELLISNKILINKGDDLETTTMNLGQTVKDHAITILLLRHNVFTKELEEDSSKKSEKK